MKGRSRTRGERGRPRNPYPVPKVHGPVNIGWHPGQEGQHFFEQGVTNAAPLIDDLFKNTIQADVRRIFK